MRNRHNSVPLHQDIFMATDIHDMGYMDVFRKKHLWRGLRAFLFVLFFFFTLSSATGLAETGHSASNDQRDAGEALLFPVRMFQQHVSGADGDRCPMAPSCSSYCIHAFKRHGPLIGFVMTCDRLLRCGRDEVRYTPSMVKGDAVYSYDPVDNNDFWWR